jgi:hypothetical protein
MKFLLVSFLSGLSVGLPLLTLLLSQKAIANHSIPNIQAANGPVNWPDSLDAVVSAPG